MLFLVANYMPRINNTAQNYIFKFYTRGYGNACAGSTIPRKMFCTNDLENSAFSRILEFADSSDAAAVEAVFVHITTT